MKTLYRNILLALVGLFVLGAILGPDPETSPSNATENETHALLAHRALGVHEINVMLDNSGFTSHEVGLSPDGGAYIIVVTAPGDSAMVAFNMALLAGSYAITEYGTPEALIGVVDHGETTPVYILNEDTANRLQKMSLDEMKTFVVDEYSDLVLSA